MNICDQQILQELSHEFSEVVSAVTVLIAIVLVVVELDAAALLLVAKLLTELVVSGLDKKN